MIVRASRLTKLAVVTAATAASTIALPATAHADSQNFQSPSGNIACNMIAGGVACDISYFTYQPPPPPECGKHFPWGSRFTLTPGKPSAIECHSDSLRVPGEPTLDYGQTISAGTLTCDSETSGIKCTDTSSGHFFQVSRDAFNLG
jgi:hypothetical protein